jgi:hypothetical protein
VHAVEVRGTFLAHCSRLPIAVVTTTLNVYLCTSKGVVHNCQYAGNLHCCEIDKGRLEKSPFTALNMRPLRRAGLNIQCILVAGCMRRKPRLTATVQFNTCQDTHAAHPARTICLHAMTHGPPSRAAQWGVLTSFAKRPCRSTPLAASRSGCCYSATCRCAGQVHQQERCMSDASHSLSWPPARAHPTVHHQKHQSFSMYWRDQPSTGRVGCGDLA